LFAHTNTIIRLTALWALAESGLGGVLFALHIPATGFLVGGFAVMLISLIAFYSKYSYRAIFQSTILVLIIKATVSPHSSPMAYVAVGFQGLMGAFLFSTIRNFRLAALLLGIIAMAESALQKLLILLLVFGKNIWVAFDTFFESICREFHVNPGISFSWLLIAFYTGAYLIWGIIVGTWAGKLPQQIETQSPQIMAAYNNSYPDITADPDEKKKSHPLFLMMPLLLLLLFVLLIFLVRPETQGTQLLYIFVRSIIAILILLYIVRPVLKFFIARWLNRRSRDHNADINTLLETMPRIRQYLRPAYQIARKEPSYWRRLRQFILCITVFTIHAR
jgi:hypothetical protein